MPGYGPFWFQRLPPDCLFSAHRPRRSLVADLRHQQRRRQYPCRRSRRPQGGFDHRRDRGRPRRRVLARRHARLCQQRGRPHVDVFDQKTGKLIKKVALSGRPNNLAVAKDGRIVVAIAQEPGALDIIDPVKLERKVSILTKGRLHNTYVTPDSRYAIMGSTRTDIFTVIDLQKEEIAWELNLGKGVRPMTMETNPDGSTKRVFMQLSDLNGFAHRRLRLAQDGRQDRVARRRQASMSSTIG